MVDVPTGRRERKKAQTRRLIADTAMELFLRRGFHDVTVTEVADAADVSVSTVFKHFPTKEALVFEEDRDIEEELLRAVAERPAGTPLLHAVRDAMVARPDGQPAGPSADLVTLVSSTPALRVHLDQMWLRYAQALGAAIARETGRDERDAEIRALARSIVGVPSVAREDDDPAAAIRTIFERLERGWGDLLDPPPAR